MAPNTGYKIILGTADLKPLRVASRTSSDQYLSRIKRAEISGGVI
jgi:hypothetical protein